jgi:hypothetical protein
MSNSTSMLKPNFRRPSLLLLLLLLLHRNKVAKVARVARRSLLYRDTSRLKKWSKMLLMGRRETCMMATGALLLSLLLLLRRDKVAGVAGVALSPFWIRAP